MYVADGTEDAERRRQRKNEEILEIKSLRRIISAYLNYPDAAEADVKRYERSFRRLPPPHKALLLHFPQKFQKLRRCIAANSYFIFSMLQAFEPPLDMSQDTDICEEAHLQNNDNCLLEVDACSCHSTSINRTRSCPKPDEGILEECENLSCKPPKGLAMDKEIEVDNCCDTNARSHAPSVLSTKTVDVHDGTEITEANENVPSLSSHKWLDPSVQLNVPLVDVDKVRCVVRNIVRDWAAEGKKERDQCYAPILEELDRLFPNRNKDRYCCYFYILNNLTLDFVSILCDFLTVHFLHNPPACLVPGAGLGRLALEISCSGFISQGNEFSYYMMICSSFILNHTRIAGQWTIYPWIHSNCNSLSDNDQHRAVSIPDIHPASAGITEGFSMCGGDFVEVYNDPDQAGIWDAVVTCFFIDTAHNVVEYIEIISRILKDGGVWINLGPLLYHFADMYGQEDEMSIELSLEDVKRIASHYGFKIEKESTIETTYTTNPRAMMQNHYYAAFWTMRKDSAAPSGHATR